MDQATKYFPLPMQSLRIIGGWCADAAERALPVFEAIAGSDLRPHAAIAGIRDFAAGGGRTHRLRILATAANAAAREAGDAAAAAAGLAAGYAAASAYTHPLRDIRQTKHIVGPAAYAALALELSRGGSTCASHAEVCWAIEHAPPEVCNVLREMPPRQPGKSRLDALLFELDSRLRTRYPD